jgi:hypothetical protein
MGQSAIDSVYNGAECMNRIHGTVHGAECMEQGRSAVCMEQRCMEHRAWNNAHGVVCMEHSAVPGAWSTVHGAVFIQLYAECSVIEVCMGRRYVRKVQCSVFQCAVFTEQKWTDGVHGANVHGTVHEAAAQQTLCMEHCAWSSHGTCAWSSVHGAV